MCVYDSIAFMNMMKLVLSVMLGCRKNIYQGELYLVGERVLSYARVRKVFVLFQGWCMNKLAGLVLSLILFDNSSTLVDNIGKCNSIIEAPLLRA